ncbi:MAG: Ribonuclease M5 [Tenericutes bacterium ADurb.BinA155]|nr:MAG: Ribonuclease M5 [Tenericutes bacterium ADurb.BinA155]
MALSHIVPAKNNQRGNLTMSDLFSLGLMGQENATQKRSYLEHNLHVGHTNAKTLLKRVNALGLTKQQIEDAIHG